MRELSVQEQGMISGGSKIAEFAGEGGALGTVVGGFVKGSLRGASRVVLPARCMEVLSAQVTNSETGYTRKHRNRESTFDVSANGSLLRLGVFPGVSIGCPLKHIH